MYTGIKLDVRVRDYSSARAALEDRCTKSRGHRDSAYPGGGWVPLGHKRSQVTTIRMARDESIVCRLYNTDVVTWHPDNSVTVVSWPTKTTSAFANALLPVGLNLGGESQVMTFFPGCDEGSDWYARWRSAHVCQGDGTYRQVDGVWLPDESTLEPMLKITLDRKLSRALSREYHFNEFKTWLFAASAHLTLEHDGVDYAGCAEAMRQRDYRRAATLLPTITVPRGFGISDRIKRLPIENTHWDWPITLGSVEYVRRWVYAREGVWDKSMVTTMTIAEHEAQRRLRGQLDRAEVYL